MRPVVLLFVAAALASAAPVGTHAQAPAPYQIGAVVPKDVAMKDIFGKDHTLGDYRGKVVFIHFWSIGALDDDPRGEKGAQATPYVRNAIAAVLAGQPIATPVNKPYGRC